MTNLTSYKLLCFDCYGTLIDWETGVVDALEPLLSKDPSKSYTREELLHTYHEFEAAEQTAGGGNTRHDSKHTFVLEPSFRPSQNPAAKATTFFRAPQISTPATAKPETTRFIVSNSNSKIICAHHPAHS